MSFRSGGRKLSFELLSSGLTADDVVDDASPRSLPETSSDGQRRRRRRSRRKQGFQSPPIAEEPRLDGDAAAPAAAFRLTDLRSVVEKVCQSSDAERSAASCVTHVGVELRQRTVAANGRLLASGDDASSSCGSSARESVAAAAAVADVFDAARRPEANGVLKKLDKDESLDWGKFIQENSNVLGEVERRDNSPFRYFIGELYSGNSLRSTIAVGNDKKRQRVYNTMFHVPWRCERCHPSLPALMEMNPRTVELWPCGCLGLWNWVRGFGFEVRGEHCHDLKTDGVFSYIYRDVLKMVWDLLMTLHLLSNLIAKYSLHTTLPSLCRLTISLSF